MAERETIQSDVCVIGAGILGLAHAFEARARGLSVVLVERGERAAGASVRNFGHLIVSAMPDGVALTCALRARQRWLELGERAGLTVQRCGTLVVARAADELEVMEGVAADPRRGVRLVSAREIARLAPIPTDTLCGGMFCELDLRVDPRRASSALAALLEDDAGARVLWRSPVHALSSGRVESARASIRADLVIVCPGPDYDLLGPELTPPRRDLTRCKLQMLRVAAPDGRRYTPGLLTALSLVRYPGYSVHPGGAQLRARLQAQRPELLAAGVNLIVAQIESGDLLIGDTHEYADTISPFGDEALDQLLLAEAGELLGVPRLTVRERWHGIYPSAPGEPFDSWRPMEGVAVVEVVSGVGMTTAFGLAPLTLDALTQSPSALARTLA